MRGSKQDATGNMGSLSWLELNEALAGCSRFVGIVDLATPILTGVETTL